MQIVLYVLYFWSIKLSNLKGQIWNFIFPWSLNFFDCLPIHFEILIDI